MNNKYSKQRETILRVLQEHPQHPSAEELHEMVRIHIPHISLGTVYRNLNVLVEMGLVRKIESADSDRAHYDGSIENHYHILCTECGKISDIPPTENISFTRILEQETEYIVSGHTLTFYGICPDCQVMKKIVP